MTTVKRTSMNRTRMNESIPMIARRQGVIALVLDQEAAEWYIDMLSTYNMRHRKDVATRADEEYLRRESELIWGDNDE